MTPLSLGELRFGWHSHISALWWLALLYRQPQRLRESLEGLPLIRAVSAGLTLLAHALPYIVVLHLLLGIAIGLEGPVQYVEMWRGAAFASFWLLSRNVAVGIAGGIAVGIGVGIAGGIAVGIAVGIAGGIAGGIAVGIAVGIGVGIAGGIAFGIAYGIAGGIAVGIAVGIGDGIGVGIAGGIVGGIAAGIVFGIAVGIAGGIAVGIGDGIAFGIAFGIAWLRAYYLAAQPIFLWPMPKGSWYPAHPVAWEISAACRSQALTGCSPTMRSAVRHVAK